jgi:hypothetical protein
MIQDRITTLMFDGGLMLLCYIIILGLIFCDLQAGIRKAKKRGEFRTSDGYKRTIAKIAQYFNMTFALSLIDIVQLALLVFLYHFYGRDIIMVPWFTLLALGYVGFVEVKSIWEPANIKEQKQQQEYRKAILALIREYGGVEKVLDALTQDKKDFEGNDIVSHEYNGDDN